MNITVKVEHEISVDRISDVLCCALEGGIRYWCAWMEPGKIPEGKKLDDFEFWHLGLPIAGGGSIILAEGEETGWQEEEERTGKIRYRHSPTNGMHELTLKRLIKGLKLLAKEYPEHMAWILDENEDADTGDILVQLALFGKVIYG